ncbi:MAG: sugar ABC transporter ATP-binding protein [Alkalispirochaeta sp.]
MSEHHLLEVRGLRKAFPGVLALDNVDFVLEKGSVHAVCGENGAGKSTLMNILMGIYGRDEGEILVKGESVQFSTPKQALEAGISIIEQELNPIPDMTVAENLFLGREDAKLGFWVDYRELNRRARETLRGIGLDQIDPETKMKRLSLAQVQLVEIAKAFSYDSDIVIMDEPTSAIGERDVDLLFALIERLRTDGKGVVYVSHRMKEIFTISDTVTVLRDGKYIGTKATKEMTRSELVSMMIGRKVEEEFIRANARREEVKLEVRNLTRAGEFENISLSVRKGEVLGVFGLMGSGRSEFMSALFGAEPADSGEIIVDGTLRTHRKARDGMRSGLAFVTEDRKKSGLVLEQSVGNNISLAHLPKLSGPLFINEQLESQLVDKYAKQFRVKTPHYGQLVKYLSGGNQQKVVLAKWLMTGPEVLLLDEPTRGIDVGAKREIYEFIAKYAKAGNAVIVISSELPEVLGISNRIVVFRRGQLVADFDGAEATQDKLMQMASEDAISEGVTKEA